LLLVMTIALIASPRAEVPTGSRLAAVALEMTFRAGIGPQSKATVIRGTSRKVTAPFPWLSILDETVKW